MWNEEGKRLAIDDEFSEPEEDSYSEMPKFKGGEYI